MDLQGFLVVHQGVVVFAVGLPEQGREIESPGVLEARFDLAGGGVQAGEVAVEIVRLHALFPRRLLGGGDLVIAPVGGHPLLVGGGAQFHGGGGDVVLTPVIQGLVGVRENALVVRRHIGAGVVVDQQGAGIAHQAGGAQPGGGVRFVVVTEGAAKGALAVFDGAAQLVHPAQFLQIEHAVTAVDAFSQQRGGPVRRHVGGPGARLGRVGLEQGAGGAAAQ